MTPHVRYFCYDEKMRASRLLSILMLLQSRGRLSATALAAELDVSYRTILRDMDQLSAAGVPVWSDRGRDGGFQLRAGWSTTLTGLTDNEAQALMLAGLPAAATELGLGSASASARLKMLAAVPESLRVDATRVSERLHIDPIDWYRAASPPAHLQAVAHAVWNQKPLQIRYDSWKKVSDRLIKPLGLVLKAGVWYLVALDEKSDEPRTFRLSNIETLSAQSSPFSYPKKFSLAGYWQIATRRFEADIYKNTATVRVTSSGLKSVMALSAVIHDAVKKSLQQSQTTGGWTQITLPIESIEHAARQFLGIGSDLVVLAPPELLAEMKAQINQLAALYPD